MILLNQYTVRFLTKKCGYRHWIINVEAENRFKAREKAEQMWMADDRYNHMHMFQIEVKRLPDTEEFLYSYFKEV